jgi:hypothetical protein
MEPGRNRHRWNTTASAANVNYRSQFRELAHTGFMNELDAAMRQISNVRTIPEVITGHWHVDD